MSSTRDIDAAEQLRRLVVRGIVEQTGLNEAHAMPYATAVVAVLQAEFGGERLHIPKPAAHLPKQSRREAIREELEAGSHWSVVARRYSISRTALYRMFPGGLPQRIRNRAE